jgi:predicted O-linked N-acetylglucosamine transferase (SPINDLY family)
LPSVPPQTSRSSQLLTQALQHHQAGRVAAAATIYAELRKLEPTGFEGFHLGGAAALQLGKLDQATTLLLQAITLRPASGITHMCLGLALGQMGQLEKAEEHLAKATKLEPKNAEAWCNYGSGLMVRGKIEDAENAFRKSLQLSPKFAEAWSALGSTLYFRGKTTEAFDCQTRALEIDPRHPKAQSVRAQNHLNSHRVEAALKDFDAHLARQPEDIEAASFRLFLLNYFDRLTPTQLWEEHRKFGQRLRVTTPSRPRHAFPNTRDPQKRLRVAFFSPDFRDHSVAFFIEPLLQHLDRDRFEIFLYHHHWCVDDVSRRLQSLATQWRNFLGQSASSIEAQILKDAPDILVDLAGHSGFNRIDALARRVAPVQINYLGYPNTSGADAMDYRFTDTIADPLEQSAPFHSEKLVYLPGTAWTYRPPEYAPTITTPPSSQGQPFTFGSFNNPSKLSNATWQLWANVLRSVPDSRLIVKGIALDSQVLQTRIADAGMDPRRLVCLPGTRTAAEHLACYEQIDVALDPFPYSGTTTTCEALWCGVPVVTLRGDRHASRVGASLLTAIGHPEWIAADGNDYVRIACELATRREPLAQVRASLRPQMASSALLDFRAQATRFGDALRACWIETLSGLQTP